MMCDGIRVPSTRFHQTSTMLVSIIIATLLPLHTTASSYAVDDTDGLGMRWEGVGAISGGGATSKLLKDYDPEVAADILDVLFKPGVGLDLDILKVEMGGDTDSTEGAEPSHMHSGFDDADYRRGYEWWLMKEAKKRKPSIKLYGLPWGFPGWLDPTANATSQAKNPFYDANTTANYTLAFLENAKTVHGLEIDYMGQWNERDAPAAYDEALRRAVSRSPIVGNITTVLNRLPHYPGTGTKNADCTDKIWNATDGRYWVDEEGSIFDGRSARCLARCVNRQYVTGCNTATFQWHLISSFYDYLPWSRCGVAVANRPWDGSYEITSPAWALAHTTQFSDPGWRYTLHDHGVTMLEGGGSMVTRVSPDNMHFSVVVEKMTTENSVCARGNNPKVDVREEDVVLALGGRLLDAAKAANGLRVWYSDMTSANDEGVNPPDDRVFRKHDDLRVGDDGTIRFAVKPEEIWTLTTLKTGQKGWNNRSVPSPSPFPLPFVQIFDDESVPSPAKFWYDQMGAWEIAAEEHGSNNQVMRQVSTVWPACWGYSCTGPTSYFGAQEFNASGNLTAWIDVKLERDDAAFTLSVENGGKTIHGVTLDSRNGGSFTIVPDGSKGKANFNVGQWHTVELRMSETSADVLLDGAVIGTGDGPGSRSFYFKMQLDSYVYAQMDNWRIARQSGG